MGAPAEGALAVIVGPLQAKAIAGHVLKATNSCWR
jgi:hypothetical protein